MKHATLIALTSALALAAGAAHAQQVIAKDGHALPDWSGVWQMVGNTVFDQATKSPANGVAGLPNRGLDSRFARERLFDDCLNSSAGNVGTTRAAPASDATPPPQ